MNKFILLISLLVSSLFAELKVANNTQLLKMKEEGVQIIDIRRLDEWKSYGIIEGAQTITFFDIDGNYDAEKWLEKFSLVVKSKEQPFIIYCAHANRTKVLGNFLNKKLGYKNVYELEGGINYGWLDKGLKTVKYQ